MKMIVIGSGALVALIVLIVYVASESREEKIERFQSEIRPLLSSRNVFMPEVFPTFWRVKLEGDMNATSKEGWSAGSVGTYTRTAKK